MRKQENSTIEELYDRIWKTKSARLNAYQRLSKTYFLSSYATSLLSVYVIILSLLQPFKIISSENTIQTINFATICVSVTLLVFVLMESSMQYNLKAEKFHDCAKEISKLFKKYEFIKENTTLNEEDKYKKFKNIQDKYDKIIDLYENHRPIDFKFFQSNNKLKEYKEDYTLIFNLKIKFGNFNRWYIKYKYNHLIFIHYYIVIFIIPIILIYLLCVK
ncbi:SLATT domain-containing protein [Flavobacterium aquidurense]|uniref:SMODS and SLOG-associating 2TM effector domain-containing protein n=1 Tax=Flavobacterium aquidurense TaxID=362413 RepID=A0A0Q0XP66_9FLAO|nr:SLATT domain-containing protein [Flavobacterium aquidurense]KQB37631.1 hypothetical protein RC62_2797 [Flavobacterium aquidurense]